MLLKHLRAEVEADMGCDDLEICPADDCEYNIVQLKETKTITITIFSTF